jgi:hypothetical protein
VCPFSLSREKTTDHRSTSESVCKQQGQYTRWFKYDRDYLCANNLQFVPVIFEPPCTCNVILWRMRLIIVASKKQKSIKYYQFACGVLPFLSGVHVAFFCVFSSVTCMAVPYFVTLPHKRHDLRKKY